MTLPLSSRQQTGLLVLTGSYCVVALMMNYLCMKPLAFWTGFVWMDGGLVVSWLVFLISNILTEVYGKKIANLVAVIAMVVTLFMSLVATLVVHIPTLPGYETQAEHFRYIFSNGPRTICSSALAFYLGNLVNIEIIYRFKQHTTNDNHLRFTFRAIISTIVGQLVDNGLFQTLAFAPIGLSLFEMRWTDIFTAIGMSTAVEVAIESAFIPILTIPLTQFLREKR